VPDIAATMLVRQSLILEGERARTPIASGSAYITALPRARCLTLV